MTTSAVRAGLEPVPAGTFRVADDAEGIARHAVAIIRHKEAAAALGSLGKSWVQSRFTWEASVLALESARESREIHPAAAPAAAPPGKPGTATPPAIYPRAGRC